MEISGKKARRNKGRGSGAIGGGLWTMAERLTSQSSQLVIFVVAARILGPADFGVFALVAACAILLMRLAEGGWSPYILSYAGDSTVPRQVLLVAIISGAMAAVAGGLVGLTLPFVGFSTQIVTLVVLFSGWVLLAVTSSAQKAILIWQGRLRAAAVSEIFGEIAGLGVALMALYGGQGVLSLVYGRLAFQTVQLIVSFSITRLSPLPGMERTAFREMMRVSGQFFISRMIYNFRVYAATFMVGAFLGPAAVGFYRAAERLTGAMGEVVGVPTQTLAWNLFRQAREDDNGGTGKFQAVANTFFPVLLAAAVPLFVWLSIMGEDLIRGLLGEEWLPTLPVLAVLVFARAINLVGFLTEPILSLAGQIHRLPAISVLYLLVTIVAVLVSAPFGLIPLAVAQVGVSSVVAGTTFWLLHRHAGLEWGAILRRLPRIVLAIVIGAGTMVLLRNSPMTASWPPLLRAFGLILPVVIVYAGALVALEPTVRGLVMGRLRAARGN